MTNRNPILLLRPIPAAAVRVPVQTTFRQMSTSPAVEQLVDDEAQNLGRFFDGITHCHVVIASPHRHHRHGRRFSVHIELSVPHGPIVATHEPADIQTAAGDAYAAVRTAFATARRQLENHVRRLRGGSKPPRTHGNEI